MTRRELESTLRHRAARDPLVRVVRDAARAAARPVWLCGGFVRDAALRRRARDVDALVTRGAPALVRELQRRWGRRGFRFSKRGVTTWRFVVDGREFDLVDATRRGLDRDLLRRELTLNAMAFDLLASRLHDPLGGLADLRAGRLRPATERGMRDDPVRALRLARFLAQLPGFRPHPAARRQAAAVAPALRRVAVERVAPELDRLLAAPAPRRGLEELARLGLVEPVLPELVPLRSCTAGDERPDVWTHTLHAIELSAGASRLPGSAAARAPAGGRRVLRWALLLHDIAKPDTLAFREDGRPTFHGHEMLGARRADRLLRRLRLPRADRQRICRLVRFHLRPGHLADAGAPPRGLRRLAREAGDDLPLLVHHAACDARASGSPDAAARWRRLRGVLVALLDLADRKRRRPLPRLIDGRTLMRELQLEPGPAVGRILEEVRERQEAGEVGTRAEALACARRAARRLSPRG